MPPRRLGCLSVALAASRRDKGKNCAPRVRNHGNDKPKSVSPRTRINQFPGQGFSESFGKLYCQPWAKKEIRKDKETGCHALLVGWGRVTRETRDDEPPRHQSSSPHGKGRRVR